MKKNSIILLAVLLLTLSAMAFKASNAEGSKEDIKSVAWYSANIRAAQAKNKQCYADKNSKSNPECVNALHALEISFGVSHQ